MRFYWLVIGILCVWRVTHLLNAEDGPLDMIVRLRKRAGKGFWGNLLDCFYCLSLWTAVPLALIIGEAWRERLLLWLALSAGALMLERVINFGHAVSPAKYFEYKENEDVLLRQKEDRVPPSDRDQSVS